VLAVNKMDLIGFSEPGFRTIETDFQEFAKQLGVADVTAVPVSALAGDNVVSASARTRWYHGTTLLAYLETATRSPRSTRPRTACGSRSFSTGSA
jgi:bifunctional enzyme CysN/CysC